MARFCIFLVFCLLFETTPVTGGGLGINDCSVSLPSICPANLGNQRFRTIDGSCNHDGNLGASGTPLRRAAANAYNDGASTPRTLGFNGAPLPSPATVGEAFHRHSFSVDGFTPILMQWGQFLDHDLVLTPHITLEDHTELECCTEDRDFQVNEPEGCFPISVDGPDFLGFAGPCMPLSRSSPFDFSTVVSSGDCFSVREQSNDITAFVDASNVYGSSAEELALLRDSPDNSYLKASGDGLLLPPNSDSASCRDPGDAGDRCFLAGDVRVNEQPGLAAMHTVWMRLHNRIVDDLLDINPDCDPDLCFNVARKVVSALAQHITYSEWLPIILGDQVMEEFDLNPLPPTRVEHDPTVDPSIVNAFATAAFRFGHTLVVQGYNVRSVFERLEDHFFRTKLIHDDFYGVVKALLDSQHVFQAQTLDIHLVEAVTDLLFVEEEGFAFDLSALNIQRGRDHGLPGYNAFREACGFEPFTNFSEFGFFSDEMQNIYDDPDDVDLFTGGLAEPQADYGAVGPTFGCLLANQFRDLQRGDRFFYRSTSTRRGFTNDQLAEISRMTMSHILCNFPSHDEFNDDDSDVLRSIQENAFRKVHEFNTEVDCSFLRDEFIDFEAWREDL